MIFDQAAKLWAATPEGNFRVKEWSDDDTVVYDVSSGDTHVVDALAMEILDLLRHRSALSAESLTADLSEIFDGETDDEIEVRVERALVRLQRVGLAARRPL